MLPALTPLHFQQLQPLWGLWLLLPNLRHWKVVQLLLLVLMLDLLWTLEHLVHLYFQQLQLLWDGWLVLPNLRHWKIVQLLLLVLMLHLLWA